MSALDPEHLDTQMDAHAYTCIETRVCLVQCWKPATAALSLKAVYCDRHTAFSPSLSPCSLSFSLFFSLFHLNVAVAHLHMLCKALIPPCCIGSFGIASAWVSAICCISRVFLVVRHSPNSHGQCSGLGRKRKWIREGSGIPHQWKNWVINWLHHINHVWFELFLNHEQLYGCCNSPLHCQKTVNLYLNEKSSRHL